MRRRSAGDRGRDAAHGGSRSRHTVGSRADVARHYIAARGPCRTCCPSTRASRAPTEQTMISLLGSPRMPLTTVGQNERASDLVKRNLVIERMSPLFRLQGLVPAIADLKARAGPRIRSGARPRRAYCRPRACSASACANRPMAPSARTSPITRGAQQSTSRSPASTPRPTPGPPCRGSLRS